jgi:hypothetical protein
MEVAAWLGSGDAVEEERTEKWGQLERERRRPACMVQTKKGNTFLWRRHQHTGQRGRRGRLRPAGKVGLAQAGLG